jgi:hypothetical protein
MQKGFTRLATDKQISFGISLNYILEYFGVDIWLVYHMPRGQSDRRSHYQLATFAKFAYFSFISGLLFC